MIEKGYNSVQQKLKSLRQGFSKAKISGTKLGSYRFKHHHYKTMKAIWEGSPNVKPVLTGYPYDDIYGATTDDSSTTAMLNNDSASTRTISSSTSF